MMNAESMKFTPNTLRVMLIKNETYRVPASAKAIRVVAGRAWLALNGTDVISNAGETLAVNADGVISPVGKTPLIIEVIGA